MTDEEVKDIQPLRIRLVTARAGDRPEDLVANYMGGISQACRKRSRDNTGIWSDLISRRCGSNRPAWRRWMAGR